MCGIFIHPKREDFLELYKINKERGDFSFGACCAFDTPLSHPFQYIYKAKELDEHQIDHNMKFYLGHTRAPTIAHGDFDPANSHPFESLSWVVGHNGILKNFTKLNEIYKSGSAVDSSILPIMLDILPINTTLEMLDGIYGLWMYNKNDQSVHLARCASTLYYRETDHAVSSAKIEDGVLLDEGVVYKWHPKFPLERVTTFKYKSPYFVL